MAVFSILSELPDLLALRPPFYLNMRSPSGFAADPKFWLLDVSFCIVWLSSITLFFEVEYICCACASTESHA